SSARAALLDQTVKAALHFLIHKTAMPGLISAKVAALTKGALKAMFMTKLKFLTVALLTVTLIGTGSAVWAFRPSSETSPVVEEKGTDDQKPRTKQEHKEESSHKQARVEEVINKSFRTGRAPRLIVETFNGGIDVVAKTEGTVDVRITKRGTGQTEEDA